MTMASRINLNIGYISLPSNFLFQKELDQILEQIYKQSLKKIQDSKSVIEDRTYSAKIILQGLYECYKCLTPKASLSIPRSNSAYSKTDITKITTHTHSAILSVLEALVNLGWVKEDIGGMKKGQKVISTYKPQGALLDKFQSIGIVWQEAKVNSRDPIVLRTKIDDERIDLPVPDTREVRLMRSNLKKINKFLSEQAICLHMTNEHLMEIADEMCSDDYQTDISEEKKRRVFNFSHTRLRRIFSRGSMNKGGRFYDGWWENLPSKYRGYITINGEPTIEVDYSELHPRMMYLDNGLPIPDGDMYDIGLNYANDEEKDAKRSIIKICLNALLNDESGGYQLEKDQREILGMSTKDLKEKLFKKHPIMKSLLKKGIGMSYQFRDSQIAEKIMLRLMDKGIVCLPVHDSFICSYIKDKAEELINEMKAVYIEELGADPKLKGFEKYKSDFQMKTLPNGELDREHLFKMHSESIHNKYVQSWRQARGIGGRRL
jgi:hypothetical protein